MAHDKTQTCSTCKFWATEVPLTAASAECRAHPPQTNAGMKIQGAEVMAAGVRWPVTLAAWWCGEWVKG